MPGLVILLLLLSLICFGAAFLISAAREHKLMAAGAALWVGSLLVTALDAYPK